MKKIIIFIVLNLISGFSFSQGINSMNVSQNNNITDQDIYAEYSKYMHEMNANDLESSDLVEYNMGEIIVSTAKFFIGTSYVANTLDITNSNENPELLIVNLHEMDCMTFVDNVLALVLDRKSLYKSETDVQDIKRPSYDNFKNKLKSIRYRKSVVSYTARLHYGIDWCKEAVKNGYLKDISKELGILYPHKINFMSSHINNYKTLKNHPEFIKDIIKVEKDLNNDDVYYVPKSNIDSIVNEIQDGDILALTTDIIGLDVSHFVIAYWQDDILKYIHCSLSKRMVTVSNQSLKHKLYLNPHTTGFIIMRAE